MEAYRYPILRLLFFLSTAMAGSNVLADRLKAFIQDCSMLGAKDGQSGLERTSHGGVDCIITELHLPDMSRLEWLVEIVPRRIAVINSHAHP
jgi:CheY-like chemotaxis protein